MDFRSTGWRAGETVSAFAVTPTPPGGASGSTVGTAVADSSGVASFTGLVASTQFVASGATSLRTVKFQTAKPFVLDTDSASSGPTTGLEGLGVVDHGLVLTRNTSNAWEAGLVEGPAVFWDPVSQRWGMTYVGYEAAKTTPQVGLAWSNDLVRWKRNAATPMFSGTGVDGQPDCTVTGPRIWYEGGVYYLFYIGCSTFGFEAGTKRLCLATASSLAGPWTRRGPIVSPTGVSSGAGAWRGIAIWHPSIVKVGSTYHLFFNASGYGDVADERIGHAQSESLLGPWVVDAFELLSKGAGGQWDELRVNDPCVYRVGDIWYMAYGGVNAASTSFDGLAFTTAEKFPGGWTKHPQNPILSPQYGANTGGGRPEIINASGVHYHFFTAQGSGQNAIGLAMPPGASAPGPWQFVGGGAGDDPDQDAMDAAWFPAFSANWQSWGGTQFNPPAYRMEDGGRTLRPKGLAKLTVTRVPATNSVVYTLPVQMWPRREEGFNGSSFDAGSSLDAPIGLRFEQTGAVKITFGTTAANSGYWLAQSVPLR